MADSSHGRLAGDLGGGRLARTKLVREFLVHKLNGGAGIAHLYSSAASKPLKRRKTHGCDEMRTDRPTATT
jgi:hypothetical protein